MRYLLDTCILIHYTTDRNNGKLVSKYWKTSKQMIDAIKDEFFIQILPLNEEHMRTYSELELNTLQDHKDPSDHIIISHAITERLPLITDDGKFEFYKKQGLDLIINKK